MVSSESATDQKTDKKGLSYAEVKSIQDHLECSKVEPGCKPGGGLKRGRHIGGADGGFGKKK